MDVRNRLIRDIMRFSHELGREINYDETLQKAENLHRYLVDHEGKVDCDIDYALCYMLELLERINRH